MSAKITVLISGGGSNLQAILAAIERQDIDGQVCMVMTDRDCAGITHAIDRHIPVARISRVRDDALFAQNMLRLIPDETDLIVLAGFLSILPEPVIRAYPKRIINLHPSLLPKYGGAGMYGLRVHQAVLDAGEQRSGCTVHYVDQGIDSGEIITQASVPIYPDDNATTLQQRVQEQEHLLLCRVVADLCTTFSLPHNPHK